jgi:hypothetical protein
MKRKILVILSNRWNRSQKPKFIELESDEKGQIHKERPLRGQPGKPVYDEVWESDRGKLELSSAYRMKRKYGHPLQKRKD